MAGATGDCRDLTADEKTFVVGLKAAIEAKAGATFATFEPVQVKTQTVAGMNYFVKVNVGDNCAHVRIYKPISGEPSVAGVLTGKACGDALEYFDAN